MTIRMLGAALALSTAAAAQFVFEPRADTVLPSAFQPGVAAGDVNGDGAPDVVVGMDPMSVLLNDARGSFTITPTAIRDRATLLALGDLDGDGALDVVRAVDNRIETALGHGDGTFAPPVVLPIPSNNIVLDLIVTDMTNDGVLDVVRVTGDLFSGQMDVRLGVGAGDGTIITELLVQGPEGGFKPLAIDVGDLDGDAFPDLALVISSSTTSSIRLLTSNGAASFTPVATIGLGVGNKAGDVRLEDVIGDDIDDLVVTGDFGLVTFRGLGGAAFAPFTLESVDEDAGEILIADLDDDGFDDLAYENDSSELVVLGKVGGDAFEETLALTGVGPSRGVEAADFDGDGRLDIGYYSTLDGGIGAYTTLRNRTYGADDPWTDVGHGLTGVAFLSDPGRPVLIAEGTLVGGDPVTLELFRNGSPQYAGALVVGFSQLGAPYKGGTFVPSPDVLVGPLVLPPRGVLEISADFPFGVASATEVVLQMWTVPLGSQSAFAASSGVVGVTP